MGPHRETSRVAIVTGGGTGIGRSVGRELARSGCHVVLAGRTRRTLEEAAVPHPDAIDFRVCDVTESGAADRVLSEVARAHGHVDILVNNAGVNGRAAPIDELTESDWRDVIDTNLTGSFLMATAAFRIMKTQDPPGGRIINVGSVAAQSPRPHQAAYAASKSGVTSLTRSIALEGRAFGIACGQIDIGNAATTMTHDFRGGALQADGSTRPEPTFDVALAAKAIVAMALLPPEANMLHQTIMATAMPLVGRG